MDTSLTPQQALALAVNRMGSQAAMGRLCGVTQQAVWKWLDEGMELPAEHVLKVEAATHVSRHDLRPDLYPRGLQDGVPYCPDSEGVAAIGDLAAGASPEWPVAPAGDHDAENGDEVFQPAGDGR
jgi:DNA-binding transcriptional regulator YdaS (Cro superfamily)